MVKIRSSKKNYITNSVDNKVQALVERFLDEKSVAKQREYLKKKQEFEERSQKVNDNLDSDSSEDDEDWKNDPSFDILKDPYPETYFAKDLDYLETLNFCLSKDLSLKRVKKLSMEKTLDRVLKNVIDAEEKEFQAENEDVDMDIEDSNDVIIIDDNEDPDIKIEKESIDQSNMIPDVDLSNNMNKDIVSTWNVNKVNKKIDVVNSKKRSREDTQTTKSNKKSKTQDRSPPNSDLSQLGGMDDIVSQLMELIGLPILHPEIYKTTGVDPPRGILLHGPPGCGKTTIANAIAGELKVPFISVSAPSVVSGMSGESEKKLRELFDEAKSLAPCIMFFDEIDAITPKRWWCSKRNGKKNCCSAAYIHG